MPPLKKQGSVLKKADDDEHDSKSMTHVDQLKQAIKFVKATLLDKERRRKLTLEKFTEQDKDNSGSLEPDEVLILVSKIAKKYQFPMPPEDKTKELLRLCDKSGDGALQLGEFRGFFQALLKSALKRARAELAELGHAEKPKFYPADDIKPKVPTARELQSRGIAKLRKSITPGTVLILLGGRFRGRRVVFLKQLRSGLLLVTGPYEVNGVPLRRVNQAYVIATSTKVDVSGLKGADVDEITDATFGKPKASRDKKRKRDADALFDEPAAEASGPSEEMVKKQKAIDSKVVPAVSKAGPDFAKYLKARFHLSKGDAPHKMKF